jgi:hypothetical protein
VVSGGYKTLPYEFRCWFGLAAKDIVCADVDQAGSEFLSNHSDIAGAQCIYRKGFILLIFAIINSNKGGGIDDYVGFIFAERVLHRTHVADFDVFIGERDKFKISKDLTKVSA